LIREIKAIKNKIKSDILLTVGIFPVGLSFAFVGLIVDVFFNQFGFKSELTPLNGKSELTPLNGSSYSPCCNKRMRAHPTIDVLGMDSLTPRPRFHIRRLSEVK